MLNNITFSSLKDFAYDHSVELLLLGTSIVAFGFNIAAGFFALTCTALITAKNMNAHEWKYVRENSALLGALTISGAVCTLSPCLGIVIAESAIAIELAQMIGGKNDKNVTISVYS
jgi:Na+-translocating ferredoxin:NAD+ oxidoreductase RnfD subunit